MQPFFQHKLLRVSPWLSAVAGLFLIGCGSNSDSTSAANQHYNNSIGQTGVWYQVNSDPTQNEAIEAASVQLFGAVTSVAVAPGKQVYWTVPVQVTDGAKAFHGVVSRSNATNQGILNYSIQIQTADSFPTLASGQLTAEQLSQPFTVDLSAYDNETVLVILSMSVDGIMGSVELSQLGLY